MADLPPVSSNFDDPLPESPDPNLAPYRSRGPTGTTTGYLPRRPLQPPQGQGGVPIPDMEQYTKQAMAYYPIDQAGKAIEMATKFVGQRGYQQDLANGMSAAQAFAKWGPMLFHGTAGTGMAAAIRGSQPPAPKLHFGTEGEVLKENPDGSVTTVRPARAGFEPAPVQGFPVMDPDTGKAIPEFFATPSPSGKGMTVHLKRPAGEMKPDQALKWLGKLPDLELDYPGIRGTLEPVLRARAESVAPKKETPAPNKPGKEVVRTTKDGKRAVFDVDTKKFLRYAD